MAEPTSALTLQDLILKVAKAASVAYYGSTGQSRATVPVDDATFQQCLDVVNEGIRFFIASAPPTGWRWMNRLMEVTLAPAYTGTATAGTATSLTDSDLAADYANDFFNLYTIKIVAGTGVGETATVTDYTGASGKFDFSGGLSGGSTPDTTSEYRICRSLNVIDADPARYQLSQDFQGEVTGDITYKADSNRGHLLSWVNEAEIRRLRETQIMDGYPSRAAVLPYTGRRWELILDPSPTAADTIVFPYRIGFDKMDAISGLATGATHNGTSTLVDSAIANLYADDYFNGWTIRIISGTGRSSYAVVTDYTSSTGTFTVADFLKIDGTAGGVDPVATSGYYAAESEQHPAGMQFDQAIEAACLAQAELEFEDLKLGYMDKFLTLDLPHAHAIDVRSAPLKLGTMLPGTRRAGFTRIWNDVYKK